MGYKHEMWAIVSKYKFIFQNEFSEIQWGMSCNIESTGYKCVKCVLDTL